MAGAYCRFCHLRCFVLRVIPEGPEKGRVLHLATCRRGMAYDLAHGGYTHLTAINPVTGEIAGDAEGESSVAGLEE